MAERFAPEAFGARRPGSRPQPSSAALAEQLLVPRRLSLPGRGFVLVLTGVALAPAALLGGLLWFGTIEKPAGEVDLAVPAASNQQAAMAAALRLPATPVTPQFVVTAPEEIVAKQGAEVPFAIRIAPGEALPARSVIALHDIPEGAAFSKGRPFGTREWSLRPDEIPGLTLKLPQRDAGPADMRVELVAADGAVLARTATRLEIAPPSPEPIARPGEADRVEDLMARGRAMIAVGYFAGARAYYQRAAEAGSGDAALATGATYDPAFIAALGVQGIMPEPEAAEAWYGRGAALGVPDPEAKLAALKEDWLLAIEEPVETTIGAEQPHAAAAGESASDGGEESTAAADGQAEAPASSPFGRLVAAASELTGRGKWVEVTGAVNVRKEASGTAETLGVVQKGTKYKVLGQDGNWVHVLDPATNEEGWIYARFLKDIEPPQRSAGPVPPPG